MTETNIRLKTYERIRDYIKAKRKTTKSDILKLNVDFYSLKTAIEKLLKDGVIVYEDGIKRYKRNRYKREELIVRKNKIIKWIGE